MKLDDESSATFYDTTHYYWSNQDTSAPSFMGVATYGGGGLLEADYRGREETRNFRKLARLSTQSRVLELGSGNGRWILAIAPEVAFYEAVDFSAQMLALSRQRVSAAGLNNVSFVESSLQDYTPSDVFDVIYLAGVSLYLSDDDLCQLLLRLRNFLSPNGCVIERSTYHRRSREVILFRPEDKYAAIYRTGDEINTLFQAAGYMKTHQMESYEYFNFPGRVIHFFNKKAILDWISKNSKFSYPVLRYLSKVQNYRKGYFGEMSHYSHKFLSFRASEPPLASESPKH